MINLHRYKTQWHVYRYTPIHIYLFTYLHFPNLWTQATVESVRTRTLSWCRLLAPPATWGFSPTSRARPWASAEPRYTPACRPPTSLSVAASTVAGNTGSIRVSDLTEEQHRTFAEECNYWGWLSNWGTNCHYDFHLYTAEIVSWHFSWYIWQWWPQKDYIWLLSYSYVYCEQFLFDVFRLDR